MLSIQDVGTQIFNKTPLKFYVFGGVEYGIKCRYIDMMKSMYSKYKEVPTVQAVIDLMSGKHLIPLQPTLYVVRYDEEFISKLNDAVAKQIQNLNIVGTIVCIYESDKHIQKCDKYLSKYTVSIDSVNKQFLFKYLKQDFPDINDRFIQLVCKIASDYANAKIICNSIKYSNQNELYSLSDSEIENLFHLEFSSDDSYVKTCIASRNFKQLYRLLDKDLIDLNTFTYSVLSTMIELEKILCSKYAESPLLPYAKLWKRESVYNLFMIGYNELKKLRTISSDAKSSAMYLISLLSVGNVPDVGVL